MASTTQTSEIQDARIPISVAPTKKLINSPETSVDDNLRGLVALYPQLRLHPRQRVVSLNQDGVKTTVALVSGGGSGHEPFAAGYVGHGMLSAAVCGGIFTSPPSSHALHAVTYLHRYNTGGVLVIIPNYTGDRLNFGMSIEKARNAGLRVESLIVDEDLASGHGTSTAGARGMCGLTIIYKICGALAAEGAELSQIRDAGLEVLNNMATFGVSLRACSIPGQPPLFDISNEDMELGTGVHGEAGTRRTKLGSAREVTVTVLEHLVEKLKIKSGSRVVALVNNMGATTTLEINIVCAEIAQYFKNKNVKLERLYAGHVMTCLDMHGFQINLLHLTNSHATTWLRLLDTTTDAPAWVGCSMSLPTSTESILPDENFGEFINAKIVNGPEMNADQIKLFKICLTTAANAVIAQEDKLNRLDSGCGDGDCGSTLRILAEAVNRYSASSDLRRPADVMAKLSDIAETGMGGTSGGIYSLGFNAASSAMADEIAITPEVWLKTWKHANEAIRKYGRAKPGDRTLVDTLVPAANTFSELLPTQGLRDTLIATLTAAEDGARATATMKAGAGRASYVSEQHLRGEDAGARGAAVWLTAVLQCVLDSL